MANELPADEDFVIDPDVAEILESLRANRMQWIADEVEDIIRKGAIDIITTRSTRQSKSRKVEEVRGLTSAEQVSVVIKALHTYIILAPQIWLEAQLNLQNAMPIDQVPLVIQIAPFGTDVDPIQVTSIEADEIVEAARKVLSRRTDERGEIQE